MNRQRNIEWRVANTYYAYLAILFILFLNNVLLLNFLLFYLKGLLDRFSYLRTLFNLILSYQEGLLYGFCDLFYRSQVVDLVYA